MGEAGLSELQKMILATAARSHRPMKIITVNPVLGPAEVVIKTCLEKVAEKEGLQDVLDLQRRGLIRLKLRSRRLGHREYELTDEAIQLGSELAEA